MRVGRGTAGRTTASVAPTLALGEVSAWVDGNNVRLANGDRSLSGTVDLSSRIADIVVPHDAEPRPFDITCMLTIAAALLLVRAGRTPVHAGAVVHPDTGRAWLLVGDTHTGKSTTTANLMKAGWQYLSDDYIVLSGGDGDSVEVEGWPDDFHLDEGWHRGESTGVRATVKEEDLPQGRRARHAVLDGVLFTRIDADRPTKVARMSPVMALERLIRQSPWLVADARHAGKVFELLTDVASHACGELSLGRDTLADHRLLDSILRNFAELET